MTITDWQGKHSLTVSIGTDHGGYDLKQKLIPILELRGIRVVDCGPFALDPKDDYPEFAHPVARSVSLGRVDIGLLICRSGVGMGIVANRYPGVRAVVAYSTAVASASRRHNCSNVLVLPADYADEALQLAILDTWLSTAFEGARHVPRLEMIECGAWFPAAQIHNTDSEISDIIFDGYLKTHSSLNLVASENCVSRAVKAAQGTYLTDKYAEGNIAARHYPDCDVVDRIEQVCIDRACQLFGAEAANVQSYSGSLANLAVFTALLHPNDAVLAMNPVCGGHSTHFSKSHLSGHLYKVTFYEPDPDTELLNYNLIEKMALSARPKLLLAGGSVYPRTLDFERLRKIADRVNAKLVVDMAHVAGLVASGIYPSPVPYADVVTSTTHKTLRGPRGGLILCKERYLNAINNAVFPMIQGGPLMHTIAAKAVAFHEAMQPDFKVYQERVVDNARTLAKLFEKAGIRVVTGGTDSHMLVLDMKSTGFTGPEIAKALESANINVNAVPVLGDDVSSEDNLSGIRIGTPCITTLGMTDMPLIAQWITTIARAPQDEQIISDVRAEVARAVRPFYKY